MHINPFKLEAKKKDRLTQPFSFYLRHTNDLR